MMRQTLRVVACTMSVVAAFVCRPAVVFAQHAEHRVFTGGGVSGFGLFDEARLPITSPGPAVWVTVRGMGPLALEAQHRAASDEQPPHKFLDRTNIALTVLESGALLADGIYTQRGLRRYPETSREADPLARPFVSRGWPGQVVGGTLAVGADVSLRYWLHRKKRHRLERLVPLILITYGTVGAIHNARELRRAEKGR